MYVTQILSSLCVCVRGEGVTSISCVIRELLSDDYSETYYRDDGTPVTTTPTDIVNRRCYTYNPTPLFTAPVSLKSPSEAPARLGFIVPLTRDILCH